MKRFLVAFVVGVLRAFRLPRPTQGAQTNFIRTKPTMKNPRKLFASVLAALTIVMIASSAQAITYQVNQSWGGGTATLVGTVDVALGNYTIMNGGAHPFMNVMLTLTVNGTPFTLDHANTSQIFGTAEFFIDATMTSLTFDTANSNAGNPADLNFYDSIDTNRYVVGSNGNPHFEAAYTTAGAVIADISLPFLFGTAATGALELASAASIQRGFAIDLPLSGPSGVEDRSGRANQKFFVAMTFSNNITSVGNATTTCGVVSSWTISGPTVTFKLVGVAHGCNESDITITAKDVMDDMGNTLSSASVLMGLLLGDVNGDRVVDGTDLSIVRSDRGEHTDGTNYRSDVSNDGFINHSDVRLVQQQQGTSLP
jgi:Dockerin type I domain